MKQIDYVTRRKRQQKENWKGFLGYYLYFVGALVFITLLMRVLFPSDVIKTNVKKVEREIAKHEHLLKTEPLIKAQKVEAKEAKSIDVYVAQSVDKYYKEPHRQSEMRMIMHCLLYWESHHDQLKGHGDNGMAGGPLQFWQETWNRMRGQMIEQGYAKEIGSRYDMQQAIDTAAWAISSGRALEWGPILRRSNGIFGTDCPVPSWY